VIVNPTPNPSPNLNLTPIACKFCRWATYIEFDFVLHIWIEHRIGHGYLDTPPSLITPSREWSRDPRVLDAINEGKNIGAKLDKDSVEKLRLPCLKEGGDDRNNKNTTSSQTLFKELPKSWSQSKNSFMPVIPIEKFFKDNSGFYMPLDEHSVNESPCYPIIGVRQAGKYILYYCEICQGEYANDERVASIYLDSLEHHCLYKDPERHKTEILARLEGWLK
jgi:hypothetical protein